MKSVLTILAALLFLSASAQHNQTKNGLIVLSGSYKGSALKAESKQLHASFNYERGEMVMHVAVPQVVTANETLKRLFVSMVGADLLFHGTLSNGHVHTKSHGKLLQQYNGTFTFRGVLKPFKLAATLEHFPSGNISCVFTGNYLLNLLDFGIPAPPGENLVQVSFRQLLLKKAGEEQQ